MSLLQGIKCVFIIMDLKAKTAVGRAANPHYSHQILRDFDSQAENQSEILVPCQSS